MLSILAGFGRRLRGFVSQVKTQRRRLASGFQRENLPLWIFLTAIFLFCQFILSGNTFELYVPYEIQWEWQEVGFPRLGFGLLAGVYLFASGICFFPRLTSFIIAIFFSTYYLYGAVNKATVDLLLGFGQPLVVSASSVLPEGATSFLSGIWRSFHFPALGIYAFHFFLPLFLFFTPVLTFIYYPASERSPKHRPSWVDVLLCMGAFIYTVEFIMNFADRGDRSGLIRWPDVFFGAIAFVVAIEMCRRVLGWVLPSLGLFFFCYALFGNYLPGRFFHSGFSFNEVVAFIYGIDGIYGIIANVYASFVFLFIAFGVFLEVTKVGDVFVDLAFALVGRLRGGPAKASVISSGLVGSIVGSGAANIVITGTFTIPLMKRAGFRAHYAAAVEAVSSIGGAIMPPVMGSAAFLVAAFTETSYGYIALISLVPALMYYFSVYMSVHFHSGLAGIHGLPKTDLPRLWPLLKKDGYLLLPVFLLIVRLVIGRTPFDAAFWSILLAVILACFREETRLLALPPLVARFLGKPGWSSKNDWAGIRMNGGKQGAFGEGGSPEEGEDEAPAVRAIVKTPWVPEILRENWMLGTGALLFAVLVTQGTGVGPSLFWAFAATGVFSSPRLMKALEKAALNSLTLGVTAGVMGIVLAGVAFPGLGLKFSSIMLSYSGVLKDMYGLAQSELPMAILLCAVASYVLGMGMTISASYVLLSILAVPALTELGVPLVNAHLMILWLSLDSSLTPPFALGAFIAGGLAGADPVRTGFTGLKMAKALYILPFLMAYSPVLMDPGAFWPQVLMVWVTGFMGFYCTSAALEGYMHRKLFLWERILFLVAGGLIFFQVRWMQILGAAWMAVGIGIQHLQRTDR